MSVAGEGLTEPLPDQASPFRRTSFIMQVNMVDIAQLVSASDCGSEGRGFESHYPPQKKNRYPLGICSFSFRRIMGFEKLNAGVRGTPACRQLDGGNTIIFANGENADESLIHSHHNTAGFERPAVGESIAGQRHPVRGVDDRLFFLQTTRSEKLNADESLIHPYYSTAGSERPTAGESIRTPTNIAQKNGFLLLFRALFLLFYRR